MILHIAGAVHDDVKGPTTLRRWLKKIAAKRESAPTFVGVEYDEGAFEEIRRQRPTLRRMLRESIQGTIPDDLLDALERSLGYEGDTHTEVFADVETLWLDEGNTENLPGHAKTRSVRYLQRLNRLPQLGDTLTALRQMSEWAWEERSCQKDLARESRLARVIHERIDKQGVKCAVIIVGGAHASRDYPGNVVSLLTARGYRCDVEFMTPTGPSPDEPAKGSEFRFE